MVAVQPARPFWDAIVESQRAKDPGASSSSCCSEPSIIILGSEQSGKSTLLSSFVYKTRPPPDLKPTLGLDYKFLRASTATTTTDTTTTAKTVHHFWEIGGARSMSSTLTSLLTDRTAVLVVIDLSRPSSIIADLLYYLPLIRAAALSLPPIAIVANKYDLVAAGANTALLFGAIRSVALRYDAAVLCHAIGDRHLHQQFRQGVARLLTQRPILSGPIQTEPSLAIAAGADSDAILGLPPGVSSSPDSMASWTRAFEHAFRTAEPASSAVEVVLDPEPLVDAAL